MHPNRILGVLLILLATFAGATGATAQSGGVNYAGKTVTIVVGTAPGGSYDTYARLLGRYLGRHLPGDPNVIVTNMAGAASGVAAGYVARVAPKDGTFIAAPFASQPLDPIFEDSAALNYDPSRLNYLGSATSDDFLCIVRPDAPAATFDDMFKTEVIVGASAPDSESAIVPIMLDNVLGTKFKVVFGYPNSVDITLAIERGEIHGMCGLGWLGLKSQFMPMLTKGEVKIVVQANDKGVPELDQKGIPLTGTYIHDEQQRRILDIVYAQELFARPFFVAPEVPADRLQALRRAFIESWHDPDLLKEAATLNLDVGPASGEEIQSLLQKIYASPPELLKQVRTAIKQK